MSLHTAVSCCPWKWLCVTLFAAALRLCAESGWYDVRQGFPAGWESGRIDLREHIQAAMEAHFQVRFPGGSDPAQPLLYHTTTGIEVPEGRHVRFEANHRIVRLPSSRALFTLKDGVHFQGAVIDGNKYAHWPEFEDLGKSDYGIRMGSHCVVENCVVFNNPGIAFGSWGDYNTLSRCLAENAGYIDVKFGVMFYQGSRDRWSADGFYFRGTGNLIRECEAYDTFRWDFCASHSGARQNTFVDCRGGDVTLRSYGFIDIEGADANNRLVRCISPNSAIVIPGSARTEVIQCMASHITAYDHQNVDSVAMYERRLQAPLLDGNITTRGGIVLGGWSSRAGKLVPGAASPIVTNNRMYKTHSGPTDQYSDWSFSVHSVDGHGIVSNNILFEFDDGFTKGPGLKLDNVPGAHNQVVYGQWALDLPVPRLRYGHFPAALLEARVLQRSHDVLQAYAAEHAAEVRYRTVHWLPLEAAFIKEGDLGDTPAAEAAAKIPDGRQGLRTLPLTGHWDFHIGTYHGAAWYYLVFSLPDAAEGERLTLFISGIDSEAEVYLNGTRVGTHSGWDRPSHLSLPATALAPGQASNLLALRVSTPAGMGGIYGPMALLWGVPAAVGGQ